MNEDSHPEAPEEPRFEILLKELEGIVDKLEGGSLPLEDALLAFERGMELTNKAGDILSRAEMKVDKLLCERDGSVREVPLEDA